MNGPPPGAEKVSSRPGAKGRFITFEGGEGSGKSTQVQRLMARLAAQGIETVVTREPGGSPRAERYRRLLLTGAVEPFGPEAEALLFAAARIDHVDTTIRPALEDGCFVICDRFVDSTRAYQGASGKVGAELIDGLEAAAAGDAMPDLTIVLDLAVEAGLARARARSGADADRFEKEGREFHEAVRRSFLDTALRHPGRCAVIDASRPPDEVERAVWAAVENRLLRERDEQFAKPQARRGRPRKLRVIEGSGGASSGKS